MIHPHVMILAERQMTAHRITEQAASRAAAGRKAPIPLQITGAYVADRLRGHFNEDTLPVQQVLAVAEEAGEFTAAWRRWAGLARRRGTWHDVQAELADVVITAYTTAAVLGIDLDTAVAAKTEVIFNRPWREPAPAA